MRPLTNVLVVGSGAREHAIVSKLLGQGSRVRDVYVAPGNAGTGMIARNLPIDVEDVGSLQRAVLQYKIDLTIVGPEAALAAGVVDVFQASRFRIFGPSQAAARVESSKAFARDLMAKAGVPHPEGRSFTDLHEARDYVYRTGTPIVIKADGLAAGKGVVIAFSPAEADAALEDALLRRTFGDAGATVVIEEYLEGPEVSLLAFTDGKTVVPMVPAADYKRVFDGGLGPNTGGMGAYSPPPFFGPEQMAWSKDHILQPMVDALAAEGCPFVGVLYAGLMVTRDGIKVLEFNARFGDPETQVILPRLKTDLVEIANACIDGRLDTLKVEWSDDACVGVVLTSEGYPGPYPTGRAITGLDRLEDGVRVYHGGTQVPPAQGNTGLGRFFNANLPTVPLDELLSGNVQTAGGRVLTVVAGGATVTDARARVYRNVAYVNFEGAHYRKDIGLPPLEPADPGTKPARAQLPPRSPGVGNG